jgi:glucose/arabinose dehydrogenase
MGDVIRAYGAAGRRGPEPQSSKAVVARPLLALALAAALPLSAATAADPDTSGAARGVRLLNVGRFSEPVYVTAPPADRNRLFVVEKAGRIRVIRRGRVLSRPFLDLRRRVGSSGHEQGLFSVAFEPDYASSLRFYVYFTDNRGDVKVEEFRRSRGNADRADRRTRRTLVRQPHHRFRNHNGGQLQFGPDGLLYAGLGDGGGAGDPLRSGQDLGTLLGKIIRIDPRRGGGRPYRIPGGNPFRRRRGARGEIYAYGLRNPWRFSFDRSTGDLAIGDVGQDRVEEIDFEPRGAGRGANFGWSKFEGRRRFRGGRAPGHVPPVIQRSHSSGNCSITGGYVVRDRALTALFGRYVYGDYCTGGLRSAVLQRQVARGDRSVGLRVPSLSSFGEDALGRVYAASLGGRVYRLAPR